jgi:hypothetical protein
LNFPFKPIKGPNNKLSSDYGSVTVFILEVVAQEWLDPSSGLPSKVGGSLKAIAPSLGKLIVVKIYIKFHLKKKVL